MASPMYRQIAEDLRQQIETGTLRPGSQLPTELSTPRAVQRVAEYRPGCHQVAHEPRPSRNTTRPGHVRRRGGRPIRHHAVGRSFDRIGGATKARAIYRK